MTDQTRPYSLAMKMMEEKLKEFMSKEEYSEFADYVARVMYRMAIDGMHGSEFKEFCKENFDLIVGGKDEVKN